MGETNHLGNHPFGNPHLSARGELAKWGELKIVDLAGQAFMYIWLVRVRSEMAACALRRLVPGRCKGMAPIRAFQTSSLCRSQELGDDGLPKDYKLKTLKAGSRRLDTFVNRASGKSSAQVEKLILGGRVRINEDVQTKKSTVSRSCFLHGDLVNGTVNRGHRRDGRRLFVVCQMAAFIIDANKLFNVLGLAMAGLSKALLHQQILLVFIIMRAKSEGSAVQDCKRLAAVATALIARIR
ncbi:unnamed protein product [Heligmosomoides polygyrus]|uniref:S4 RNA-binding domain-containing protein n=1 Tax=Heligmosomoides polygyrus TaxID=6339 RepID=A0A183FYU8_HELPZ|nr:unnamed protein product [Heligmosomoides polygyrus]